MGYNFLFCNLVAATPAGRRSRTHQDYWDRKAYVTKMQENTHTYAVPVLVEGEGTMPRIEVHANDRALTKPRREFQFVPFVLQQTFKDRISFKVFADDQGQKAFNNSSSPVYESPQLSSSWPSKLPKLYLNFSRFTSEVPTPTIYTKTGWNGKINSACSERGKTHSGRFYYSLKKIFDTPTHHISPIHGRGHLDLPVVLAVAELLVAADCSGAAAVVRVKAHLPVVTAQKGSGGLKVIIPHPVKTWTHTPCTA